MAPAAIVEAKLRYLRADEVERAAELEDREGRLKLWSKVLHWLLWGLAFAYVITLARSVTGSLEYYLQLIPSLIFLATLVTWYGRRRLKEKVVNLRDDQDFLKLEIEAVRVSGVDGESSSLRPAELSRILLPRRIRRLRQRENTVTLWLFIWIGVFTMFLTMAVWFAVSDQALIFGKTKLNEGTRNFFALGTLMYGVAALVGAASRYNVLRSIRGEIREAEITLDLGQYQVTPAEERAEKLFRRNQFDLQQYYRLNIQQNRIAFLLGLLCIGIGVGVIWFTMNKVENMTTNATTSDGAKTIVAAIGIVSAIMTNVVAAVFLRLQSSASRDLNQFHKRLVGTSDLFLSNVIAARLNDGDLKQSTLAKMSLVMAERSGSDEVLSESSPAGKKSTQGAG